MSDEELSIVISDEDLSSDDGDTRADHGANLRWFKSAPVVGSSSAPRAPSRPAAKRKDSIARHIRSFTHVKQGMGQTAPGAPVPGGPGAPPPGIKSFKSFSSIGPGAAGPTGRAGMTPMPAPSAPGLPRKAFGSDRNLTSAMLPASGMNSAVSSVLGARPTGPPIRAVLPSSSNPATNAPRLGRAGFHWNAGLLRIAACIEHLKSCVSPLEGGGYLFSIHSDKFLFADRVVVLNAMNTWKLTKQITHCKATFGKFQGMGPIISSMMNLKSLHLLWDPSCPAAAAEAPPMVDSDSDLDDYADETDEQARIRAISEKVVSMLRLPRQRPSDLVELFHNVKCGQLQELVVSGFVGFGTVATDLASNAMATLAVNNASTLTRLDLSNNGITAGGLGSLERMFLRLAPGSLILRDLCLQGNGDLDSRIACHLAWLRLLRQRAASDIQVPLSPSSALAALVSPIRTNTSANLAASARLNLAAPPDVKLTAMNVTDMPLSDPDTLAAMAKITAQMTAIQFHNCSCRYLLAEDSLVLKAWKSSSIGLISLDFEDCDMDAIQMQQLCSALSCMPALTSLSFAGCSFDDDCPQVLEQCLRLCHDPPLKELVLPALVTVPELDLLLRIRLEMWKDTVDLHGKLGPRGRLSPPTPAGLALTCDLLNAAANMVAIDLSCNRLSPSDIHALCTAIVSGRSRLLMRELDLTDSGLSDEGCIHVAAAVRALPSIECVYLHDNDLSDEATQRITAALAGEKDGHVEWRIPERNTTGTGGLQLAASSQSEFSDRAAGPIKANVYAARSRQTQDMRAPFVQTVDFVERELKPEIGGKLLSSFLAELQVQPLNCGRLRFDRLVMGIMTIRRLLRQILRKTSRSKPLTWSQKFRARQATIANTSVADPRHLPPSVMSHGPETIQARQRRQRLQLAVVGLGKVSDSGQLTLPQPHSPFRVVGTIAHIVSSIGRCAMEPGSDAYSTLTLYHGFVDPDPRKLCVGYFEGYPEEIPHSVGMEAFEWELLPRLRMRVKGLFCDVLVRKVGFYCLLWNWSEGPPQQLISLQWFVPQYGWGRPQGPCPLRVRVVAADATTATTTASAPVDGVDMVLCEGPAGLGALDLQVGLLTPLCFEIEDQVYQLPLWPGNEVVLPLHRFHMTKHTGEVQSIVTKVWWYSQQSAVEECQPPTVTQVVPVQPPVAYSEPPVLGHCHELAHTVQLLVRSVVPDAPTGLSVKARKRQTTILRIDGYVTSKQWPHPVELQVYLKKFTSTEFTGFDRNKPDGRRLMEDLTQFQLVHSQTRAAGAEWEVEIANSFYAALARVVATNIYGSSTACAAITIHPTAGVSDLSRAHGKGADVWPPADATAAATNGEAAVDSASPRARKGVQPTAAVSKPVSRVSSDESTKAPEPPPTVNVRAANSVSPRAVAGGRRVKQPLTSPIIPVTESRHKPRRVGAAGGGGDKEELSLTISLPRITRQEFF